MTTDRPAAPTRGTALADRTARGGTQAPPTDAFSALLGAAAPKSDAPARGDERPARRDEPRWENGPLERRPHGPERDEHRRPDAPASEVPAGEAIVTSCEPEAPAETPAAPTTPSLFALQLASPLPSAPAPPATPPASAATPPVPVPVPVLPILSSIVPASVATATAPTTATATTTVAGEVAAVPTVPAEPAAPAAVAASALAAVLADASTAAATPDGEVTTPEHPLKPQAPAAQPTVAQAAATTAQPQTSADADAETSGQPNSPSPTPTPTPAATAAAAAAQPKAAEPAEPAAPVAAAQPITPAPTVAPAGPAAANGLPNVERAVPLSRAVATTGVLIQLASERGVTHARLNLKPVELGGIEVKLHSTPAGIHAQLVAESPEAARMLAQAGDDLKRQLEDRNVNLLSLDVSTSSDQRDDQPRFADGFGDDHRPGGHPSASREDTVLMESPVAADTVLILPDGVHVDILA